MQSFDIVHHPLAEGTCLIEAGAGTGKTYALTAIFLRLLFEKRIAPDGILVVTFTTAATAELRDRLRRQLLAIRCFLDDDGPLDDTLQAIVERTGNTAQVREGIAAALREFDRIAIFTIHGFCQRLLGELAFETDSPFEIELRTDASAWIQGVADDYWREVFFAAAPELVDYALAQLGGPETLANLYHRYGMPDLRLIPEVPDLPRIDFAPFRRRHNDLRRRWPAVRAEIASILQDPALNGTVYGSLKQAPGAPPGVTKRAQKVGNWCRSLDYSLCRANAPLPLDPSLVYFTTNKIARSTRKGQTPPVHAFFDDCQDLQDSGERLQKALDHWLAALRFGFFSYAEGKLDDIKKARQTLFFDDLLLQVDRALAGKGGHRLTAAVRRRYQAALVDEFQDTDPTQYAIFKRLFDTADHLLFMIGDPKQAIYGFRGADIFSYLQAVRQARQKYTLVQNWRSRPELIQAVNHLFANHSHPFLIPDIVYHQAVAAPRDATAHTDPPTTAPMTFWVVPAVDAEGSRSSRALTKPQATAKILAAIAAEVGRLLRPPPHAPDAAPAYAAQDIAILVRTNRQARLVKTCMQEAGIPAVIHNAGSVFETPEADEFEHLLQAVAQPDDTGKLKTALATRFFGVGGGRLDFGEDPPDWWNEVQQRFFGYRAIWREIGFYPFFQRMLSGNHIAERLLTLTDGERRLTNLLHLGELMQQNTTPKRAGLQDALKWLREQKTLPSGNIDAQQLRMESDARALTILTIHKSKGLEFPVVFCPFNWESDTGRNEWPLFHDPEAGMRRTLYIGAEANTDYQNQALTERRAESLRRLYVAVTRARTRCYLVWGALPGATASALGYLVNPAAADPDPLPDKKIQPPAEPAGKKSMDDPVSALERLAHKSDSTIVVTPLPEPDVLSGAFAIPDQELQPERTMMRRLDPHWSIASFSSLIRNAGTGMANPEDRDQAVPMTAPAAIDSAETASATKLADDIHLFPKGAHAGNLFHRLFEILDYRQTDARAWQPRMAIEMAHYGFEPKWVMPVTRLIQNVLATPLPPETPSFSLNRLDSSACVKEMPFAFRLNRLKADRLRAVFHNHDLPLSSQSVDNQLERLNFIISGGYLRGFIDLVFRSQDRYYLLDWKSNHLGDTYADYGTAQIETVMAENYYFLQYHLYVVALDQFLRQRLPNYAYEKHFGGVYYLFIRGMRSDNDTGRGLFYDRPENGLVTALRRLLLQTV